MEESEGLQRCSSTATTVQLEEGPWEYGCQPYLLQEGRVVPVELPEDVERADPGGLRRGDLEALAGEDNQAGGGSEVPSYDPLVLGENRWRREIVSDEVPVVAVSNDCWGWEEGRRTEPGAELEGDSPFGRPRPGTTGHRAQRIAFCQLWRDGDVEERVRLFWEV